MILNNYNNSLSENKVSNLTFLSNRCPLLVVRGFNPIIQYGNHLIIEYCVDAHDGRYYKQQRIGNTYTTIVAIDENVLPAEDVTSVVKTTYAGNHMLDLGVIEGYGEHSFSIKTIQDDGIESSTLYFKFYIADPNFEDSALNLETASSPISITYSGTPSEERQYYEEFDDRYFDINNLSIVDIYSGNNTPTYNRSFTTDTSSYIISKILSSNNLREIQIEVSGTLERRVINGARYSHTINRTGTYHLTNYFLDANNTERNLLDYIGVPRAELPIEAIKAAGRNKEALTTLFRAAKSGGYNKLVMPKDWTIVITYDSPDGSTTPATDTTKNRFDVSFPDDFVADFNGMTLKSLQTSLGEGRLIKARNNYNTSIRNLNVVGPYINRALASAKEAQYMGTIGYEDCSFCTLENIDASHSCGYELTGSMAVIASTGGVSSKNELFTHTGYIDYNGNFVSIPTKTDSNGDSSTVPQYWCKKDSFSRIIANDVNSNYHEFHVGKHWNYFIIGFQGASTEMTGLNTNLCHGCGSDQRGTMTEFFIHYYDSNNQFIKTVKVRPRDPLLPPYGAVSFKLSAKGCLEPGHADSLHYKSSSSTYSFLRHFFSARSFCNRAINLRVHDGRTCVCGWFQHQFFNKGLRAWNMTQEPEGSDMNNTAWPTKAVTPIFLDSEDRSFEHSDMWMTDAEIFYSNDTASKLIWGRRYEFSDIRGIEIDIINIYLGAIRNCCSSTVAKSERYDSNIEEHYFQIDNCYLVGLNGDKTGNGTTTKRPARNIMYVTNSTIDREYGGIIETINNTTLL